MFRDHVGADSAVEELATADFKSYIRFRRSRNPKLRNVSVNKDLTYLSRLLSSANEYFKQLDGYVPPRIPWEPESSKPNDRVIYKDEAAALLAYLRDPAVHPGEKPNSPEIRRDYADMFELAMNSAMRWGEVAQIEWSMINLRAAEVVLPKQITKTDEPRTVPLNSRLVEILRRRHASKWTKWVFPRADGLSYRKYYADRLGSIAKKLGLAFGRDTGFTLHATRHSSITEMQNQGADLATVQQISGHSSRTMALRYSHTNRKRVQDAVETLVEKPADSSGHRTGNGQLFSEPPATNGRRDT
jgi:integrase